MPENLPDDALRAAGVGGRIALAESPQLDVESLGERGIGGERSRAVKLTEDPEEPRVSGRGLGPAGRGPPADESGLQPSICSWLETWGAAPG